MTEGIDWIARSAARAKGRRPDYFADPAVDRLYSLAMALAAELSVVRERLDTLERLLEAKNTLLRSDIEAFVPDTDAGYERGLETRSYITRVMRSFQQDVEAMENLEPPIVDLVEKLSRE